MKAIILAAGEGRRLTPLTNDIPKSMVKLFGMTLLERQINTFRKCDINDIIIIYDDIDIDLGNIRFKPFGTDGGHNGIKSIIYHLESDNFDRLKVGIGTNENSLVAKLNKYIQITNV